MSNATKLYRFKSYAIMLTKTLIITSVETYVSKNYNVNKES